MRTRARIALLAPAVLLAAGCTNYYKVTDTASGRTYYTTDIERQRKTNVITFKDAKSGSEVTLPSSEIKEIKKDEYKTAVEAK